MIAFFAPRVPSPTHHVATPVILKGFLRDVARGMARRQKTRRPGPFGPGRHREVRGAVESVEGRSVC